MARAKLFHIKSREEWGLEIACEYNFIIMGEEFSIKWLKTKLMIEDYERSYSATNCIQFAYRLRISEDYRFKMIVENKSVLRWTYNTICTCQDFNKGRH